MKNNNPDVILPYYFVDHQGLIWPKTKDDFIYKKRKKKEVREAVMEGMKAKFHTIPNSSSIPRILRTGRESKYLVLT